MASSRVTPFQYKTVIKDITTSITNCPCRDQIKYPKKTSFMNTTYTTKGNTFNNNNLKINYIEPNAGHNATVNQYVFDPSLTTLKKPDPKDKIEFSEPVIDETIYDNATNLQSENLLNNIDKDLDLLKKENNRHIKTKNKKKGTCPPNYITEEEIQKEKENILKNMEASNNHFLEKKRRGKENLERFLKLNEGRTDLKDILNSNSNLETNCNIKNTEEEVQAILNKEKELTTKRVEKMKAYSLKFQKSKKIKRKGYTEHKPIDENDEKFIKKYARYLLFKKIKDDIIGDNDDDYEREYAKFIFTANTQDSPRSLSLNNSPKKTTKKKIIVPDSNSLNVSDIKNNNYSFIAFIKMIYAMLDKEKKGTISKNAILNELYLDDKILQDLGFESHEQFINSLNNYEPEDKEQGELNEKDFVQFLLGECDFKDEILYYLNNTPETTSKLKKKKKNKRKKKGDSDSEIEISDFDSSEDLPGMRTHVYDFLECGNYKEKLDKLNEILKEPSNKEQTKKCFRSSSQKKMKIKVRNEKIRISYHEYLTFLRRYHTKDQINFTIPQPFEFLKRDYQQKKMMKIKEILEEKVKAEDVYIYHQFRAIKLKEGIWGNRMENIIQYEKQQRMKRQEKLKEKIVAEMKPFSFYDADERKYREKLQQECQPPTFPPFRANAIKWLSQVNIYEDMIKKQKQEREERVKERMEKTMKASRLPPRMQMHMEEKKRKEEEDKLYGRDKKRSHTPKNHFRANPVPDFLRLQQEFESQLEYEKEKKKKKLTEPEPFTFHEPKKKLELCSYLDKENNPNVKNPSIKNDINAIVHKMQRKPKLEPSTTKSLNLLMEARRKEIEEKQRKIDEMNLEDRLRKEKQERLKERVQTSKAIVDNKKQLEENKRKMQEDFKNNLNKNKELYRADLQRRMQRVYNGPLLFEQVGNKGEKFSLNKNMKDDLNELLVEQVGMEGEENDPNEEENFDEDQNQGNEEEGEAEQVDGTEIEHPEVEGDGELEIDDEHEGEIEDEQEEEEEQDEHNNTL